jgi:hypothetical protein
MAGYVVWLGKIRRSSPALDSQHWKLQINLVRHGNTYAYGLDGPESNTGQKSDYLFPKTVQTRSEARPVPLLKGYRSSFPVIKWRGREFEHSPNLVPKPPYGSTVWTNSPL